MLEVLKGLGQSNCRIAHKKVPKSDIFSMKKTVGSTPRIIRKMVFLIGQVPIYNSTLFLLFNIWEIEKIYFEMICPPPPPP